MSTWKWLGLSIGLILVGSLLESGIVPRMMVVLSVTVFLLLFAAGPLAGVIPRRPGW